MSHGEAGKDSARSSDILAADGKTINTDWIIEQFVFNYIQHVPKLFFIQACRYVYIVFCIFDTYNKYFCLFKRRE